MRKHDLYNFGEFQIDAGEQRLWHGEDLIPITPKEFEVLFYLVEHAGEVAEKNDLIDAIWQDTFVEEATLARNVSWLRKKLRKFSKGEKFIETIPKRGYRFTADVTKSDKNESLIIIEEQTTQHFRSEESITITDVNLEREANQPLALPQSKPKSKIKTLNLILVTFGILITAGISFIIYQNYNRGKEVKAIVASRVVPFSGAEGREDGPAFSPDGKQLAFSWNGGEGDKRNIYVRLVNAGKPLQLTESKLNNRYPTFSPDGSHIAFLRQSKTSGELIVIPALGGAERRISQLFSGNYSISYSTDGEDIAVIDTENSKAGGQYAIFLINAQTFQRRRLTAPAEFTGETTPRFSPDGKSLAFVRISKDNKQDLFIVPSTGGEPRQITFDGVVIHSLTWSADGKMIYFVSFRETNYPRLWRIPVEGGEPQFVTVGGKNISNVAMSSNGKTLAIVDNFNYWSIWKVPADGQDASKFISANGRDVGAKISRNGSKILFVSDRRGTMDIWLADSEGKNLRQITNSMKEISNPQFSPDASQIVLQRHDGEKPGIYMVSSEGGLPKLIIEDNSRYLLPTFSVNGEWIYFTSNKSGEFQIYKINADGNGRVIKITENGGFLNKITPDGKTIYYTKSRFEGGIWRMPLDGGKEEYLALFTEAGFKQKFAEGINEYGNQWIMANEGIYFLTIDSGQIYKIKYYDFATEQITETVGDYKIPSNIDTMFGMTTDGNNFLFSVRATPISNIMLAELPR